MYAQSKACTGGLYVDHPGCCSVVQVGSRCLSLSCLTTVRRCPQICSNASCFALGTDLRGIRRIVFLLAMALLALSSPPGAEVEVQPRPPEKCNPRLRWKTALTIALLQEAKVFGGPLRCPSLTRLPVWEPIPGPLLTNHSCSAIRAQIISLRSNDLVVPKLPACGCE